MEIISADLSGCGVDLTASLSAVLCIPGNVPEVRALGKEGSHKGGPGALWKFWMGRPEARPGFSTLSPSQATPSFQLQCPPLYHEVGVNSEPLLAVNGLSPLSTGRLK